MTNVLLSSAKYAKNEAFFDILMTITLEVNKITRKMTPFFHLLSKLCQLVYFIFAFKDLQNSVSRLHFVLFCKIHIYMPNMPLSSLLTWISILYIKFANFWYIMQSAPNLIQIWSRSHGLYLSLTFIKSKIK